jgi:hypothetical protein
MRPTKIVVLMAGILLSAISTDRIISDEQFDPEWCGNALADRAARLDEMFPQRTLGEDWKAAKKRK